MDDLVQRLRCKSGAWINGLYEDEAADEIERLRAELDLRRKSGSASEGLHNLCAGIAADADGSEWSREEWERIDAENARLRAQLAERDRDAERYRWLRDVGDSTWTPLMKRGPSFATNMDAAIDAAMAPKP